MKDVRAYNTVVVERDPTAGQPALAEATAYGKPVVPALLVSSLFATLIATELPVRGATIVGQMLKFPRPVYVGETVTASIEITGVREERKVLQLATQASTARGICVDGEAVVSYGASLALG